MVLGGVFKYPKLASSTLEMNTEMHSNFKGGEIAQSCDSL